MAGAYRHAIEDGAGFVVGPLTKEDVAAVVPVRAVKTPQLALNFLGDTVNAGHEFYQFALLPVSAREVRVHLHPEDARLVRDRLVEVTADRAWSIAEDPILARGGCRVTSENSMIDAQLEQRLGAAIATVLGDTRDESGSGA